jgi:ferredoxin
MRAPDLFELSEIDGHSSPVAEEIPADREGEALEAARSCPEQAITVS